MREYTLARLRVLSVPIVAALSFQLGCAAGGSTDVDDPGSPAGSAGSSSGGDGGDGGDAGSAGSGGEAGGGAGGEAGGGAGGEAGGGAGGEAGGGAGGEAGGGAGGVGGGGTGGVRGELCNGLDDDGDEDIDEDDPEGGGPCTVAGAFGQCAIGTEHCLVGKLECVADFVAEEEICNQLDDDCDDEVDEENPGGNESCDTELDGVCSVGVTRCDENGDVVCEPFVEPGDQAETCNGLDDDCDGPSDEGNPGGGASCLVSGEEGACEQGVTECAGGQVTCKQVNFSEQEVCDGDDNDCDGGVDNGSMPRIGDTCDVPGKEGICLIGKMSCEFGSEQCKQQFSASEEICDGDDNDCDGSVDEMPMPNIFRDCTIDAFGVCMFGEYQCLSGNKSCEPLFAASTEVCDGLDNDCDGPVDELPMPGIGNDCTVPDKLGLCSIGKNTCGGRAGVQCTPQNVSSQEVCDGDDNDCDGGTDELPMPGIEENCTVAGLMGICAAGLTACNGGLQSCAQVVAPLPAELCNGFDDDCDGGTDEDDPWVMCQANCGGTGTFDRVSSLSCNGGCNVLGCEDGYIDANFDACDGCETFTCVSTTSACNQPHVLDVDDTFSGTLRSTNEEAWIRVDFSALFPSSTPAYKINLVNGSGSGYVMDVLESCTTTNYAACGAGNGQQILEWEVDFGAQRDKLKPCSGAACTHTSAAIVGNSKLIRIRRNSVAAGQECIQFQVQFTKL